MYQIIAWKCLQSRKMITRLEILDAAPLTVNLFPIVVSFASLPVQPSIQTLLNSRTLSPISLIQIHYITGKCHPISGQFTWTYDIYFAAIGDADAPSVCRSAVIGDRVLLPAISLKPQDAHWSSRWEQSRWLVGWRLHWLTFLLGRTAAERWR